MSFACKSSQKISNLPTSRTFHPKIERVISTAREYLGTPYKYAGNSKAGIDCSGLTCKAYENIGIQLPRSAEEQIKVGRKVSMKDIQQGDLVFFKPSKNASSITHVGIIAKVSATRKDVTFIHASTSKGVIESQLFSTYWQPLIAGFVRIIE